MDDKLNVSEITLSGFVDLNRCRYLYFFLLLTVYILILFSDCSIVYLICIKENLHEPMYIFIAALLINSALYSTTVYPKLLIDLLSEKQIISYSACLFQFFVFYSTGAAEYLLLAVMAYDRYVSICKPLRHATIMRKTTVNISLILAWSFPACHVAVPAILNAKAKICQSEFKGIFCNNTIYKLHCVTTRTITFFGVLIVLDVVLMPLFFTVYTYTRILVIAYHSSKEFKRKAAETCLPHLFITVSTFFFISYDVIVARVESDLPQIARFLMTLQIILYQPLFNPLIYGFKMKEISKHLKKLFCSNKV